MFDRKEYMKEYHKKSNPRRLWFKNKWISLKEDPRNHICSNCGKQGYTQIHHTEYHNDDPLKDAVELCASCHAKESLKLGQLTGLGKTKRRGY